LEYFSFSCVFSLILSLFFPLAPVSLICFFFGYLCLPSSNSAIPM
jgi:hypothetical protein